MLSHLLHPRINTHLLTPLVTCVLTQLFVCKYEYKEGKQTKLDAHIDGTPYSFVVALNNPSTEFTGGGTRFTSSDLTYRPSTAGTAVIFSGKNEHEGKIRD